MSRLQHLTLSSFVLLFSTLASAQVSQADYDNCVMSASLQQIAQGRCDVSQADDSLTCEDTPFGPSCGVELHRGTAAFHLAAALWHSATGSYEDAVASLDSAIVLAPRDGYARALLGYAQAQTGDVQEAIWTFRDALALNDRNAEAFYQRGLVKEQLGDSWGALADLRSAIGVDPDDFRFHLRQAVILATSADYSEALAAADRAVGTSNGDCAECFFMAGALRFSAESPSESELGCSYLSRAGELGNERSYDLIRQYCRL